MELRLIYTDQLNFRFSASNNMDLKVFMDTIGNKKDKDSDASPMDSIDESVSLSILNPMSLLRFRRKLIDQLLH